MIRVVIADDHVLFAEAMSAALVQRGYQVEKVVRTGKDAVEAVGELRPDLVLLDLNLPDSSGVEVGRVIGHVAPATKILVVTAGNDPKLVWRSMRAGFRGYVTKESSMSTFLDAIESVLAGRTVTPPRPRIAETPSVDPRGKAPLEALTPREQQILDLLASGARTKQIASMLHIANNTVRSHVQAVLSKLGAHTRLEAVAIARREGLLLDPDGQGARPDTDLVGEPLP